jgi:gliding motility-associated-like protein
MNVNFTRSLVLLILLFYLNFNSCYAQKEHNIWYFGFNAGLDFNSESPKALTNGQVSSSIGASSLCDSDGNLLFYTDGNQVWDRNHSQMPNGFGLRGEASLDFRPTVIVPNPVQKNIYYVFTVNPYNAPVLVGFSYATVDLSLQGGLGDVTSKQIPLVNPVTAVLTAVKHANGKDIWVVVQGFNENNYYAYLVTGVGVNPTPVISSIGSANRSYGNKQMKASPDGSKIAVTLEDATAGFDINKLEVFRFNSATGRLTDLIFSISSNDPGALRDLSGVEFSPNNSLLYSTNRDSSGSDYVYQFDLNAGTAEDIKKSRIAIFLPLHGLQENMQLGPDDKIYVVHGGGRDWDHVSRIEHPNVRGLGCQYVEEAIYLEGRQAIIGLPIFIQSYFNSSPSIESTQACVSDSLSFFAHSIGSVDSLKWDFGDPHSGRSNISSVECPRHKYSTSGSFTVTLTTYLSGILNQISSTVTVHSIPNISLGADTVICSGSSFILNGGNWTTYKWSTGDTTSSISIKQSGLYWLEASNGYCSNRDSIQIQILPTPKVDLGNDIIICNPPPLMLDAKNNGLIYQWATGSTAQQIEIMNSGKYWVKVSNGKCYQVDTVQVAFVGVYNLSSSVHKDSLEYDEQAEFTADGSDIMEWYWDFGDGTNSYMQNPVHTYQYDGLYQVTVQAKNKNGCLSIKKLEVYQKPYLFIPNIFTPNGDGKNDSFTILYNGKAPYNLIIQNRWGRQVFASRDKNLQWDGVHTEPGLFFYNLQIGINHYKGWVHLLR